METKGIKGSLDAHRLRVYPTSMDAEVDHLIDLKQTSGDKTLVIGIGGSGCQLLRRVYEQHSKTSDLRFLAINSDYKELRLLGDLGIPMFELKRSVSPVPGEDTESQKHSLSMFNGQGAGGDPSVGKRMMLENEKLFLERFSDFEKELGGSDSHFCRVMLLYGYGGGTGAGASLVIAEKLRERYPYLELYGLVVTPRLAGSAERMKEIVEAVKEMEKYIDVFIPIDQEGLYRAYKDQTQADASAKLYDVALKNINAFLLMIGVPTERNIDASDLARGLGVRDTENERHAQCVIAGYVEGNLETFPPVSGLENIKDGKLLQLLYAAVPGEFIYFRNVRGARVGIVKIVYGKDVCPSMNQLKVLEAQVQALAKAAPGEFTLMLSYGPSASVPDNEYKFAVFFSQFQGENKMPLSERLQTDYDKWMEKEKKNQINNDKVIEFNTYREDDDEMASDDPSSSSPNEDNSAQLAQDEEQQSEPLQREPAQPEGAQQLFSIVDFAQPAKVAMAPVIEEHTASDKKTRRRAAAAQMGMIEASKEAGMPLQRQLELPIQVDIDGSRTFNPLSMDPALAAEAWQRREREKEN